MTKKVLIADDYDDGRRMMKVMLETHGYETIEAADGIEAVEKAHKYHPDIILMDIAMPMLDGLKATEAIRQFDDDPDVPIVALTAYGDFYEEKALAAGCNEVISKPFEYYELEAAIDGYLNLDENPGLRKTTF
jgi:Response regulator containing CheY-like receiver, AAA-type ATPase, and DNA-binding domains